MNEVMGWLAVTISLIALGLSIWTSWEMRRQSVATEVNTIDTLHSTVSQAYLDYPEMRAIFYEGENGIQPKEMGRDDKLRAAAIAEMLCDSMERSLSGDAKGMPEMIEPVRAWVDDMLRHSRYLRAWLRKRAVWYQGPVISRLEAIEAESTSTSSEDSLEGVDS